MPGRSGSRRGTLVDRFAAMAERSGSTVTLVDTWDDMAALIRRLADGEPVAVGPALARQQPDFVDALGDRVLHPSYMDVAAIADVAVGVMACPLAVAETGSVVVDEHDLADRVVSMLSRTLVQVVCSGAIVGSLDDVAVWLSGLQGPGYRALVTGPSRTADIERSLTIGVQGPLATHVVVLRRCPGDASGSKAAPAERHPRHSDNRRAPMDDSGDDREAGT